MKPHECQVQWLWHNHFGFFFVYRQRSNSYLSIHRICTLANILRLVALIKVNIRVGQNLFLSAKIYWWLSKKNLNFFELLNMKLSKIKLPQMSSKIIRLYSFSNRNYWNTGANLFTNIQNVIHTFILLSYLLNNMHNNTIR